MKKLFAIIFSLALISAQSVAFADAAPSPGQKEKSCGCQAKCCTAKPNDASKETPAVPAPVSTLKNFQIVLSPTAWSPNPQNISNETFFASDAVPVLARRVPLFTRDCSYLL